MSNKKNHIEGYWFSEQNPEYPKPIHSDKAFTDKDLIIESLKIIEKDIYLQKNKHSKISFFKGSSTCRCCSKKVSADELTYKNWTWPSGLIHYIEDHNIRPSDLFIETVLKNFIKKG